MSNELVAPIWARIEEHSKDIHAIRERLAVMEIKHNHASDKIDDMCLQLVETDNRISEKLDLLLEAHNKREGQNTVISWVPTIISCVIGLASIVTIIRGG
jgi:hypothetical protein